MIEMSSRRKSEQRLIDAQSFVSLFDSMDRVRLPLPLEMQKRIITPRSADWDCYTNKETLEAEGCYQFIYPVHWSEVIGSNEDIEQACNKFNQSVWEEIGDDKNVIFWSHPMCVKESDGRKRLTCRFSSF